MKEDGFLLFGAAIFIVEDFFLPAFNLYSEKEVD
jgi:hypothetical protein